MKLNKKQKELILSKIDLSLETVDGIEYLYWNAGEASYNIGMKQTWSKEQQTEINEIKSDIKELRQDVSVLKKDMSEVKSELKDLRSDMNLIINHLGIKR